MEEPKIVMSKGNRRVAWNKSYSPHGYRLSEVISAVGKEIRRGKDEMAVFWALQMALSGMEAEQFLWERFRVISLEDVGPACSQAISIVESAYRLYWDLPNRHLDRLVVASSIATFLARCPKTRYPVEMMADIIDRLEEGWRPEIPDYALDLHLPHARKAGRGVLHYLTEGARLENENGSFTDEYRQRLIRRAELKENT